MKDAIVIGSVFAVAACTPIHVAAFDFSSSYSFLRCFGLESGISSQMQIGLISTSFSDTFSRVISFGTATDIRFLEAKKSVNKAEIEKYVEKYYGALPAEERDRFVAILVEAKTTDEDIKAKMASPKLTDDEKLIFAQERERLLNSTWKYEGELSDKYSELFKPNKYHQTNIKLRNIENLLEDVSMCYIDQRCGRSEEENDVEFINLEYQMISLVVDLLQSAIETGASSNDTLRSYRNEVRHIQTEFENYLQRLYSPKRKKP